MEFQKVLLNLKDIGFIYFDYLMAKTKDGKTIDTEVFLVDRTKLIQCNVRDITEARKKDTELRLYRENLEKIVKECTAELMTKAEELERFNRLFVGRELRMIELKKIIKEHDGQIASLKELIKKHEVEILSLKKPEISHT